MIIKPKPFLIKYSQNFLKSPNLVKKLLNEAIIGVNDIVYEIGPGKGIITEELARRCSRVIAIEIDKNLFKNLIQKFKSNPKIKIILGDFLKYRLPLKGNYKVFTAIPYNITTQIVQKLTNNSNPPQDIYLIIQKEAAIRFAGFPYGEEKLYSLLLKPLFEIKILHYLKRIDFYPVPKVDSVLLRIKKREELISKENIQLYKDFIIYGFSRWGPNLFKSFKHIFTYKQFKRLANDLGFNKTAKPRDLIFEQWLKLFEFFLTNVIPEKREIVKGWGKRLETQQSHLQKIHRTRKF
ncbi:23S ribosomal RNA methyltransferase Erm [bacterium]|nr:23S ribosomal RNA methyltransferase Erm [bacterium]